MAPSGSGSVSYSPEKQYGPLPPTPGPSAISRTPEKGASGMKKTTFWILICAIVVLVALVIGLGAGLGSKLAQANSTA